MPYSTVAEVKGRAIDRAVTDAGWTDTDVLERIEEADDYINSKFVRLGYSTTQLADCPLINKLSIRLARYYVMRDIFANYAPSTRGIEQIEKWVEDIEDIIEQAETGKLKLVGSDGKIKQPEGRNESLRVKISTENVKRVFDLDHPEHSKLDVEYHSDDVLGNP